MTEVVVEHLSKTYSADAAALRDVSLTARDQEFLVLVGPSGCGKSTLLRIIAGLEEPTSGKVLIGGRDVTAVPPQKRNVAMVFQNYALYPHMTVAQNLGFSLKMRKRPAIEIDRRIRETAAMLQLDSLLARKPAELSGGQQQRVALGRAVVREPEVFLFDEPLSNLDALLRDGMRRELARLHQELHTTMVYVTHDQVEAMTLGGRIAVMRDGRVEQVGSPLEVYEDPRTRFVASFLGSPPMNFLDVEYRSTPTGHELVRGNWRHPAPPEFRPPPSARVTLGVRPHQLQVASDDGSDTQLRLPTHVRSVQHLGSHRQLEFSIADQTWLATIPGDVAVPDAGPLTLTAVWSQVFWFTEDGNRVASN